MRARPRRGALGLRGRIVGAVLVTTVATLAVAAGTLLGPLEQSLRKAALHTLSSDLHKDPTARFAHLDLSLPALASGTVTSQLQSTQQALATRVGGFVYVLGFPGASGRGELLPGEQQLENAEYDPFDDAARAFLTGRSNSSFGTVGSTEYARIAIPFTRDKLPYVLAVRRPIDEIPGAVSAVRRAFITAAVAGIVLTVILGIPLAATLVRRLRRLREAAFDLAQAGPDAEMPVDRARDEVGDLARTFATMQRRLKQQEESRRAFVATASHELRTPLTSLDGMLELLDDDLRSGALDIDDALDLLARARTQSRRLGRLAADLLDLSRLDAEVRLRSEPVELSELSRAVLAEFELGTSVRAISAALEESDGTVWVLGDPGSVARILRILLDNAVRVSPRGGTITVELHGGPEPSLRVRDEGPGVPADQRGLIFERFHRGRETAGDAGFGLGLAIGRELAERMGGTLVLEDSSGTGATFTLRLPGARAPEEDVAAVV